MIALSNYFEEKQAKAVEKAQKKANAKTVLNLIELEKLTLEEIVKCTGLTLRRVQTFAKKIMIF